MSITNECLICLNSQNWSRLNQILSEESNCKKLKNDPIFQVFESYLVAEIKKLDIDDTFDIPQLVLVRIFHLNRKYKLIELSDTCLKEIAEYLFYKSPSEEYAEVLVDNSEAIKYLEAKKTESERISKNATIAANLHLKIGAKGQVLFAKKITNSPQEDELFNIAANLFPDKLIYPNVALSVIIDNKILSHLNSDQKDLYFKSSLDLCIANRQTLMPEFFFELDSSWHDKPKQLEKDKLKDDIFNKAGMTLIRIRKKENKTMEEIFKLVLNEHAS